jgi:site-specific recombinase XerD
MDLDAAITDWEQELIRQTGLAATSITQYVRDARRFATWLAEHAPVDSLANVTTGDAVNTATPWYPLVVLPPPSIVP